MRGSQPRSRSPSEVLKALVATLGLYNPILVCSMQHCRTGRMGLRGHQSPATRPPSWGMTCGRKAVLASPAPATSHRTPSVMERLQARGALCRGPHCTVPCWVPEPRPHPAPPLGPAPSLGSSQSSLPPELSLHGHWERVAPARKAVQQSHGPQTGAGDPGTALPAARGFCLRRKEVGLFAGLRAPYGPGQPANKLLPLGFPTTAGCKDNRQRWHTASRDTAECGLW